MGKFDLTNYERQVVRSLIDREWSMPDCCTVVIVSRITEVDISVVAAHYVVIAQGVDALLLEKTDEADSGEEG